MNNSVFAVPGGKLSYKCSAIAVFLVVFLMLSCIHSTPALADLTGFLNGNFNDGFSGWSANLIFSGNVDPASDSHFNLTAQGAQIGNDDFEFIATLYQDFQMSSLTSSNNKIFLNFWLQWSPIDSGQTPEIVATLSDYDPVSHQNSSGLDLLQNLTMSDLLGGTQVSLDVTSFADKSVRISFGASDNDFIVPDYLTVGNISFSEQGDNPVPIPSSVLLLISGLAGFVVLRRKSTSCLTAGRELK
jgi:hypothetical protein